MSASPYIFRGSDVAKVVPALGAAMRVQFGKSAHTEATCQGAYPGKHGGVTGFHEVHCTFAVVVLGSLGKSGTVTYWIDGHKQPQDTIHWD